MISFILTGLTEAEIREKIKAYYCNYHPAGYGTYINEPFYNTDTKTWQAAGSRASSCD